METNYGFQIKPIPDETFFGLLVATGILAGFETYAQLYSGILGNNKLCPSTLLPRGLKKISEFLPQRYRDNVDSLCFEHTALPYFQRFSRPEGLLRAKEIMSSGSEGNIRSAVGVTSTSIKENRQLKYCSACADEQQEIYNRTTWLRSHQLPGVEVCYRHGLPLTASPISTVKYGIHSNQIQLPQISGNKHTTHKIWSAGDAWDYTSPHRLIAQVSHELLFKQPAFVDSRSIGRVYRSAYISAGYCKGRYLDWAKIEFILRDRYGDLIPRKLGLDFFCQSYAHWVHQITSAQDTVRHPLQHILIMGVLFENLEQLDDAIERVVAENQVCPNSTDNSQLGQPTNFSIRKEYASSTETAPINFEKRKLDLHRKELQDFLKQNPQSTRTEIKRRMRRRYQWLLTHDLEWLQSVLPPKDIKGRKHSAQPTIDWESLDRQLASEMQRIKLEDAETIFDEKYRINRAQIARLSEFSYVHVKKLITFPQTVAVLNHLRGLCSGYAAR